MFDILEENEIMDEDGNIMETISNDPYADKYIRRIKRLTQEKDRVNESYDTVIEEYSAKKKFYEEHYNKQIEDCKTRLYSYFQTVEDGIRGSKTQKKYKLASGTLKYTFEKTDVEETPGLLDELKNLNLSYYIKTVESVKWGDFKKTLNIIEDKVISVDGEIIEGVTIKTKPAKFDVIID